jgi:hypothetical protein
MLIELIKNKESEWKCICTGNSFKHDIISRAYVTFDNIRFYSDIDKRVDELMQFPYTLNEWKMGNTSKYACKECNTVPYRIIKNKET